MTVCKKQPGGGVLKYKGFTLIELLAVIIILAVLALISVPIISGIIENTKKKALESSLWAVDSATKNYYSKLVLQDKTTFDSRIEFKIQDNVCEIIEGIDSLGCLEFESDNIRIGYVSIYSNNSASICIDDGKYYANKSASDSVVEVGNGRCTSGYSEDTKKYLATTEVTVETITSIEDRLNALEGRTTSVENRATNIENGTNSDMAKIYFLNAHPVDSIYTTVSSDEDTIEKMHNKYGGTWEVYGAGKTLVSLDSNQTEFDTINETGGEKTHALTLQEIPSHSHHITLLLSAGNQSIQYNWGTCSIKSDSYNWHDAQSSWTGNQSYDWGSTTNVGGDSNRNTVAHNNLQPYIVVYMYKRVS